MAISSGTTASAEGSQRSAYRQWSGSDDSCQVSISGETLERMRFEISRAMNGPGGQGVGGVLLGSVRGGSFRISGFHLIPCEHALGPEFRLSATEESRLPALLDAAGIHYSHLPGLGGLRRARPDSANMAWRNISFRGYADHMQTAAFGESLARCLELATAERVVLMCAEAVPWRCHRSLIADALLAQGIEVSEIVSAVRARPHSLTPFAQVDGGVVTYPAPAAAAPDRPRRRRCAKPRGRSDSNSPTSLS